MGAQMKPFILERVRKGSWLRVFEVPVPFGAQALGRADRNRCKRIWACQHCTVRNFRHAKRACEPSLKFIARKKESSGSITLFT